MDKNKNSRNANKKNAKSLKFSTISIPIIPVNLKRDRFVLLIQKFFQRGLLITSIFRPFLWFGIPSNCLQTATLENQYDARLIFNHN
jgi:hypothetical protein